MIAILFVTLLFLLAIGFDISPYLRGPSYYPPEWRWEYLFVNTLDKIWLPLIVMSFILFLFIKTESKKNVIIKYIPLFLIFLVLLSYFFQLSVLFFSRSGIGVLLHRIINPELNGYFTAALSIQNIGNFLHDYNDLVLTFVYHAGSHPPGAILFFYGIEQGIRLFSMLIDITNTITSSHADVRTIWNGLAPIEKATAMVASLLVPFISSFALVPLYYSADALYGQKIALRASFLYVFIPSLVFFIPINDALLPIFSITAFYLMVRGFAKNNNLLFFLSGAVLFAGVFSNLSLLPLLIFFLVFFLLQMYQKRLLWTKAFFITGLLFTSGFFLPPLLLFLFFQFNFVEMSFIIMKHVPHVHTRSYVLWIFYNLYDFLIFAGIPIAYVFFFAIKDGFVGLKKKILDKDNYILVAFVIMLLILNFSGSVRGETGRIWSVYMPFMVLIASIFVTKQMKFSTKLFLLFLFLQVIQILVMQEFWVMLW